METQRRLMNHIELGRHLNLSPRWLRLEAAAGRIPAVKAQGMMLFDLDTVVETLRKRAETEVAR